jgi:dCMP deaminase
MNKWDERFLRLAQQVSTWSKDPSTQVGAVITRPDRTIVSVGYNGFPRGVDDKREFLDDRPIKYLRTVHAEVNAILTAREPLQNCNLYVYPLHPCAACTGAIIQAGISHVVAFMEQEPDRWAEQFKVASRMCEEAFVRVTLVTSWSNS